jgi:integrase
VRPDRYFTLRFSFDGRQIEESLGWASDGWNLQRAQEELGKLRAAKRTGEGPATLRESAKAARRAEQQRAATEAALERQQLTVADLWERYRTEVVAVSNGAHTAAEKTRMWERCIRPEIGDLRVSQVTEEAVGRIVRAPLRLDAAGQVVGGKAQAGNLYRLLHHMFSKSLAWKLRPKEVGNPLENLSEPKVPRRERLLTADEIGGLLRAVDEAAENVSEHPQVLAVIRLLVLTGARISELLGLRWDHIHRDERECHLIGTKTGFSRRPISAAALIVIDSMERLPGVPFVFHGIKSPRERLSYSTVEKAFARVMEEAKIENCTLHTIRHWFATMTANSVSNARVGMALTGHKSHAAYMNYVHSGKDQAQELAEHIANLVKSISTSDAKQRSRVVAD